MAERQPGVIRMARTDEEVLRCFPVMHELRPHLSEADFLQRVRRQEAAGYALAFLEQDGAVRAAAGFRLLDNLASGRVLYVDDLVTLPADRSGGCGAELFSWLTEQARAAGCATLELDSGVQRFGAHRFYFGRRMFISSYHFRLPL